MLLEYNKFVYSWTLIFNDFCKLVSIKNHSILFFQSPKPILQTMITSWHYGKAIRKQSYVKK